MSNMYCFCTGPGHDRYCEQYWAAFDAVKIMRDDQRARQARKKPPRRTKATAKPTRKGKR